MKFCCKVNVIEKIINDGYEGNICYTRVPVVTEDKEIRFADNENYLYYETTINCLSIIKINQSIELKDTIIDDT
uniref:Conserved domain protein n=1 Tax=Strongyloides venezuelensis TaxID=75913 RepID=A0A0K0F0C2_STRVS